MTNLGLTDADRDMATSAITRVKWSLVIPWTVAVVMFGSNGYHRFLSGEQAIAASRQEQQTLRLEMSQLREQVQALTIEVGKLNTAISYLGQPRASAPTRSRQFDH